MPELWRCVYMLDHKVLDELDRVGSSAGGLEEPKINRNVLRAMAKVAVDRSGGQLEAFAGTQFVTDELLKYSGDRYLASFVL